MRAGEKLGVTLIAASIILLFLLAFAQRSPAASKPVEKGAIDEAMRSGAEWFLADQNERFMNYIYSPDTDTNSTTNSNLRQVAALWTASVTYRRTGDPRFKALYDKGFAYFRPRILPGAAGGSYYVNYTDSNIGESAFIILALAEADDFPGRDDYLRGLAQGIIGQQNPNGSFRIFFGKETGGNNIDYYPGEALLAFMTIYERTGNASYLDPVRKALPYYRDYWRGQRPMAFVSWQMQAYYRLYKADRNPEYRDFVYELADYATADQNASYGSAADQTAPSDGGGNISAYCDNSYDPSYSSIGSAAIMEGLEDAYSLAKSEGDLGRMRLYGENLNATLLSVMSLQYTPENLGNFSSFAIGGFRMASDDTQIRIDNAQHALFSLAKHEANFYVP